MVPIRLAMRWNDLPTTQMAASKVATSRGVQRSATCLRLKEVYIRPMAVDRCACPSPAAPGALPYILDVSVR